jgi:hypothetical protein
MQLERWLLWAVGLLGVSFVLFALPSEVEGPVLLPISADHAIATVDAIAIVPLVIASGLLYGGLWRGRRRLMDAVRARPGAGLVGSFAGGLGLGLLIASVFSGISAWWVVGAVLFTVTLVTIASIAGRY